MALAFFEHTFYFTCVLSFLPAIKSCYLFHPIAAVGVQFCHTKAPHSDGAMFGRYWKCCFFPRGAFYPSAFLGFSLLSPHTVCQGGTSAIGQGYWVSTLLNGMGGLVRACVFILLFLLGFCTCTGYVWIAFNDTAFDNPDNWDPTVCYLQSVHKKLILKCSTFPPQIH